MLIRKDQTPSVKPASVVYKTVIHRAEHVDIDLAQVELLELHSTLIRIIKILIHAD